MLFVELGGFYGEGFYFMVKILLLSLWVVMAFWKFLSLCMGIACETQMPSLWDGVVGRQRLKAWW